MLTVAHATPVTSDYISDRGGSRYIAYCTCGWYVTHHNADAIDARATAHRQEDAPAASRHAGKTAAEEREDVAAYLILEASTAQPGNAAAWVAAAANIVAGTHEGKRTRIAASLLHPETLPDEFELTRPRIGVAQ